MQFPHDVDHDVHLLFCFDLYLHLNLFVNMIKLELCTIALKVEHNVYSLVPNIDVCMYIYIDQKWIYIKL